VKKAVEKDVKSKDARPHSRGAYFLITIMKTAENIVFFLNF